MRRTITIVEAALLITLVALAGMTLAQLFLAPAVTTPPTATSSYKESDPIATLIDVSTRTYHPRKPRHHK